MRITLLWLGIVSFISSQAQTNNLLRFNGTSSKVEIGRPIQPNTSYTKEAWVFISGTTAMRNIISSNSNPFWVTNGSLAAGQGGAYALVGEIPTLPVSRWVHVAVTFDYPTRIMKLYRDGQLISTSIPLIAVYADEETFIGSHEGTLSFWSGDIDEVRIYNRALSQTELNMRMFKGPVVSDPTLRAYYKLDETSGTAALNSATAGNGINGNIVGAGRLPSPVEARANALHFDGSNDYVNIGNGGSLKMLGAVTNEAWVRSANWSVAGYSAITSCFESGGYGLTLENNSLRFSVRVSGAYSYATVASSSLTNNTWYHIAGTYDGRYIRLYVNGILVNTNDLGAGLKPIQYAYPLNSMLIGAEAGTANTPATGGYFAGEIDEVRIWNVARTGPELLANIGNELDPSNSSQTVGLVSYYTFNQGITVGTNTGLVSAPDLVGTNAGLLENFNLTGSTSNYTLQPIVLIALPVLWGPFTVQADRSNALLNWSTEQEQNSKEFEVQHSSDGTSWHKIGVVSAAGNKNTASKYSFTHSSPLNGTNYYRLAQKDFDGKFSYSEVKRLVFSSTPKDVVLQGNIVINGRIGVQVNKATTVSIFSLDGKLILRKPIATGFNNVEIKTATKGIYWFSAGGTAEKILVQ